MAGRRAVGVWTVLGVVLLAGCGESETPGVPPPPPLPAPLAVVPAQVTVRPGGQEFFGVQVRGWGVEYARTDVRWASSAPEVAAISEQGVAVAVGGGRATITAVVGDLEAAAVVEVSADAARPPEVLAVAPVAGSRVGVALRCWHAEPPCMAPAWATRVGAAFAFPGPERFASGRVFVNERDVTTGAAAAYGEGDEPPSTDLPGVEGRVLGAEAMRVGRNVVRVEATSDAGRVVTYEWSFEGIEW
jgi:hypothetical protein